MPSTGGGGRFSAPGLVKPDAPSGAGFNTRTQEISTPDMRSGLADSQRASNSMMDSLNKLSGLAMKVQLEANDQADQVRVNEALNKAVQTRLAMTYDPEQGYVHLQGKAALDRPESKSLVDEYGGKFSDAIGAISESLGNDRQRSIFMEKAGTLASQFSGNLMEHTAKEFTSHALSVQSSTVATSVGQMALSFADPTSLSQSISAIKGATAEEGRIRGWSGQQIEVAIVKNLSAGHATVVKSAIDAGMNEYAEEYFKIHNKEFTNDARLTVKAMVDDGVMEAKVQRVTDGLMDKYGRDTESAMAEVRDKYEGNERKDIETRLIAHATRERTFMKQRQDDAMTSAWDKMQKGGRVSPSDLSQMHPKDREELRKHQLSLAQGTPRKTNIGAWLTFADMPKSEMAKMTAGDLVRQFGNNLSDSDLRAAQGKIIAARDYIEKGDSTGLQMFTVQDEIKAGARRLGVIPALGRKLTGDEETALETLKYKMQDKVSLWETQNGGKKADIEVVRSLMKEEEVNQVSLRRTFSDDHSVPRITLSKKDENIAYVTVRAATGDGVEKVPVASIPDSFRVRVQRRLKDQGVPSHMTENEFAKAWVLAGKPRK